MGIDRSTGQTNKDQWAHIRRFMADEVISKTGGICYYCGAKLGKRFHCDHVLPRTSGGGDNLSNLVPSCHSCNSTKCKRSIEEFRDLLALRKLYEEHPEIPAFSPAQREWMRLNGLDLISMAPKITFWFESR